MDLEKARQMRVAHQQSKFARKNFYDENQPRDDDGKWTDGGGGGSSDGGSSDVSIGGGGGGASSGGGGSSSGEAVKSAAEVKGEKRARAALKHVDENPDSYSKVLRPKTYEQSVELRDEHRAARAAIHNELTSRGYELKAGGDSRKSGTYVKGEDQYIVRADTRSTSDRGGSASTRGGSSSSNNLSEYVLTVQRIRPFRPKT